jgi:hypothetical protein
MKLPTPQEIEAEIARRKVLIDKLTQTARTESDLSDLLEHRRAVTDLGDKLILSKNIQAQREKDRVEMETLIRKEEKQHLSDYKKLLALITKTLPVLEGVQGDVAQITDLIFNLANQSNRLRTLVGQYYELDNKGIETKNVLLLPMNAVVDYPSQLADIVKRFRILAPKHEEKKDKPEGNDGAKPPQQPAES